VLITISICGPPELSLPLLRIEAFLKAESGSASEQKTEHVDVEDPLELLFSDGLDRGSTRGGMHQEQINPVVVPGTETGRQSASLPRHHVPFSTCLTPSGL
jgi:hypothetical protein